MTVAELIKELRNYPLDMIVFKDDRNDCGNEYIEVEATEIIKISKQHTQYQESETGKEVILIG